MNMRRRIFVLSAFPSLGAYLPWHREIHMDPVIYLIACPEINRPQFFLPGIYLMMWRNSKQQQLMANTDKLH